MKTRDGLYYIMTGELFDGKKAAEMGLVNKSVPLAHLRQATRELCDVLLAKDQAVVKAAKDAFKRIQGLPWDTSEDYLVSKQEQLLFFAGHAREEGFKQFLDDKTYKPGLSVYKKRDKK
jgi:trans-feruloyl-CoA hydratase/vanillin synthase